VPVHTFRHPCEIGELVKVYDSYNILVIQNAAESLGSYSIGRRTGSFGKMGVFSSCKYKHDQIGYKHMLTSIAAGLGVAQMENINFFVDKPRELAKKYKVFFVDQGIEFIKQPATAMSNYWLNAKVLKDRPDWDEFLTVSYDHGVMSHLVWTLMSVWICSSGAIN